MAARPLHAVAGGGRSSHPHPHPTWRNNNNSNAGNHSRFRSSSRSQTTSSALDEPLPVASILKGKWKSRKKIHRTANRLATLILTNPTTTTPSSSNIISEEDTSGSLLCIAGNEYIIVANRVSYLYVYRIGSTTSTTPSTTSTSAVITEGNTNNHNNTTNNNINNINDRHHQNQNNLVSPCAIVCLKNEDNNNFTKQQEQQQSETAAASIVSLIALPYGKSIIYGESCRKDEGHIVAFSDDGRGFILRIRSTRGSSSQGGGGIGGGGGGGGDNNNTATTTITKLYEFSTMNFGVSCASVVATTSSSSPSGATTTTIKTTGAAAGGGGGGSSPPPSHHHHHREDYHLLVGYQTGYLENWKIFRFSTEKIMTKLTWRGVYPNSYWIQNIAPINLDSATDTTTTTSNTSSKSNENTSDDTTDNNNNNNNNNKETRKAETSASDPSTRYLLVTLLSNKHALKTSAMVEVIDIGSLTNEWKQHGSNSNENNKGTGGGSSTTTDQGYGHLRAIDLSNRWIMPQAGMEILNSNTISSSSTSTTRATTAMNDDNSTTNNNNNNNISGILPRRAHFIPSVCTGSISSLPGGNCVALADGTIAMISSREVSFANAAEQQRQRQQAELHWGIANDYNQLLLPYPAIGCSALNWGTTTTTTATSTTDNPAQQRQSLASYYRPHVACCLRGGSTYLIPFAPPDAEKEETPITVFTLDAETHSRYIQGFTAGNLILSGDDDNNQSESKLKNSNQPKKTTPALVYGWAGGIIDVYSCELTGTTSCRRPMIGPSEIAALEELVSNGSIGILATILAGLDDTNPLLQQPLWKQAWKESKEETINGISAKDLLLPKFSGLQALLLSLLSSDAVDCGF